MPPDSAITSRVDLGKTAPSYIMPGIMRTNKVRSHNLHYIKWHLYCWGAHSRVFFERPFNGKLVAGRQLPVWVGLSRSLKSKK